MPLSKHVVRYCFRTLTLPYQVLGPGRCAGQTFLAFTHSIAQPRNVLDQNFGEREITCFTNSDAILWRVQYGCDSLALFQLSYLPTPEF